MKPKQNLSKRVLQQLQQYDVIKADDLVCCALSGGADSVCLLRILLELQDTLKYQVTAIHVNHNLRGAESIRDEQFCRTLCENLQVPLKIVSCDVAEYAAQSHTSIELAARTCRYDAFQKVDADWITTAHNANDNLETMIHRIIRGTSLHGLTAIPPKNGRFLRPLLQVDRKEIITYLEVLDQSYMTDSTNCSDAYTRNRIRHHILPQMEKENPAVTRTTARTIESLRRDNDYLQSEANRVYASCHQTAHTLEHLNDYHPALQMRCFAKLLDEEHLSYDAQLLEQLMQLCRTGGKRNLTRNATTQVYAVAKVGRLCLEIVSRQPVPEKIPLLPGENRLYPDFLVTARVITLPQGEKNENLVKTAIVHEKFANYCFDYDKIMGSLFLTPRIYGAKMRLSGRTFTSSLKKRIQSDVPPKQRNTLHWITDDLGVVFAEYIGIADRVKPDNTTKRLLIIEITKDNMDKSHEKLEAEI